MRSSPRPCAAWWTTRPPAILRKSASSTITREEVQKVLAALAQTPDLPTGRLRQATRLSQGKLQRILDLLERCGLMEAEGETNRLTREPVDPERIPLTS